MGILSFQLREPTVTSRIGFSFLSIILLASGAILGPFGAWCVGLVSVVIDRDAKVRWFQRVFNAAMTAVVGVAGGWAYALSTRFRGPCLALGPGRHRDRARPPAAHRRRRAVPHQRAAALGRHPPLPGGPVPRLPAQGARQLRRGLRGLRRHRLPLRHPVVPGPARPVQRRPHPRAAARGHGGRSSSSATSCARTSARWTPSSPRSRPRTRLRRSGACASPGSQSGSPRRWGSVPARSAPCAMRRCCTRSVTSGCRRGCCDGHGARSATPSDGSSTATACSARG